MGEVLILVDHVDGKLRKTTAELLTIARRLGEPSAVHIGPGADPSHLEWDEKHTPLTADIEGRTNGAETHPPAVWIERFGRGFLCSTEY